jgi:hypothetical protein
MRVNLISGSKLPCLAHHPELNNLVLFRRTNLLINVQGRSKSSIRMYLYFLFLNRWEFIFRQDIHLDLNVNSQLH